MMKMHTHTHTHPIVSSTAHGNPDAWWWTIGIAWSLVVAISLFAIVGGRGGGVATALAAGAGDWLAGVAIAHSLLWFAGMAAILVLRQRRSGRRGASEVGAQPEPPAACHDPLTNLPNRTLLLDRLNQSLVRSNRNAQQTAVLSIDLNDLKAVNELCGDKVGDRVLTEVSRRMATVVRQTDTVARVGGDEFVVVLSELPGPQVAARIANDMLEAIALPIPVVNGRDVSVAACMGIAFFPTDARTPDDLLRIADAAMREVKSLDEDGFSFAAAQVA